MRFDDRDILLLSFMGLHSREAMHARRAPRTPSKVWERLEKAIGMHCHLEGS